MGHGHISADDPRAEDVRRLLQRHLDFARSSSPPEDMHALDIDGLLDPAVTFFSYRRDGELLAVGALKQLNASHGELKSMHTAVAVRGQGIGRAMVDHLVGVARTRGLERVSLETGSTEEFAAARSLYATAGFTETDPFGDYRLSPYSTFMTLKLLPRLRREPGGRMGVFANSCDSSIFRTHLRHSHQSLPRFFAARMICVTR
jgi:putative acetyltransferase